MNGVNRMPVEISGPESRRFGDFDATEKIAEGGMGTIYKGRHRVTGEHVALKVIPKHLATNAVFLRRFEKEYNAARLLDHPNVVRAIAFGQEDGTPYLAMEFVEGESLGQRLEREGKLPEAEAIRIISEVAQGLQKAHSVGLVHRDVKPDNILLTPAGQVKLTDLGLVKDSDSDLNLTRTGRGLGTPHFMAPEQFRRAKDADVRCDIYSLAATLYMMLTGELPFKACGPLDAWMRKINNELPAARHLAPEISERVDWAIRRSMSADPIQRAGSCREFVEDLTGHSTRRITGAATDVDVLEVWYLVYKDDAGVVHTVKGSTAGIRRSLKEGLLGDASEIRISRAKQGPFEPLRQRPEFRDLLVTQRRLVTPLHTPRPRTPVPLSRELPRPTERASEPPLAACTPAPAVAVSSASVSAAVSAAGAHAPHIEIRDSGESAEWLKWAALIAIAIAAGVAGYLLMPLLASLRLV